MDGTTHLSDYLAILRRRRRQVIKVAGAIFAIAVLLAVVLPPVYRSTAKLLIEHQMPPDLVPTTVAGYINQRIRVIETRVLTPDNLAKVADKVGIYADERNSGDVRNVANRMRSNIKIETVNANVTDPRSGQSGVATVAFNVSYDAPSAEEAQKIAQELAMLFVSENQALRTQKAQTTSGFLGEEEERLRKHIGELEAKLAAYKSKYQGKLPELMNLNMQMLERTQRELDEIDRQIVNLEERRVQLQSQLTLVDPHTGTSPGGRLRELQGEYAAAAARYSPDHPDVVRLKREVEALQKQTGATNERGALESEYRRAQAELSQLKERYSDDHPDVAKQKKTVASIEARMKKAPAGPTSGFAMRPDNPAYVNLQSQIDTIDLSLKAAREGREKAKQRLAEYEARVVETPKVEQEGLALQRDYESATKKYKELKQNLMGAELALSMEKGQHGERYSILEAADLPNSPERPNRKAFILLGLVLGLGSGIGYASVAEYMDRTIRGPRSVVNVLRAPPLATIPYIPNGIDPPARLT